MVDTATANHSLVEIKSGLITTSAIEFRDVSIAFDDRVLLDRISFTVPYGGMKIVVGPSNCGKSTIIKMAIGLLKPDSGQIFLDGRPAPPADAQPWWWGYSRGRWEGDTLVVESTNFRDEGWLDVNGAPLTSEGKVIERFRRPNVGTLEIDVTIDDPKAYTKPWTVRVNQRLLPDTDLIEFVCLENNQFNPATGARRSR